MPVEYQAKIPISFRVRIALVFLHETRLSSDVDECVCAASRELLEAESAGSLIKLKMIKKEN